MLIYFPHKSHLMGPLSQIHLVDTNLIYPHEQILIAVCLFPEKASLVECMFEIRKDVARISVDDDLLRSSWISRTLGQGCIPAFDFGQRLGLLEDAINHSFSAIRQNLEKANLFSISD